ncbi:MAG: (2Fe-2S)-binding protein [candidate division NC10 bacterium]|nr:(2Fe-2S)-binding protein [candidate division NC10 bacterium]
MSGHRVTVTFAPDGQQVLVPAGTTLLRAAQQTGRDIAATCGARGRCRPDAAGYFLLSRQGRQNHAAIGQLGTPICQVAGSPDRQT